MKVLITALTVIIILLILNFTYKTTKDYVKDNNDEEEGRW